MPSVGMMRTARVFGVVKGGDSAHVLRSGRRLWPGSDDCADKRANSDDDDNVVLMELVKQRNRKARRLSEPGGPGGRDRFFGRVYSRKRKRIGGNEGLKVCRKQGMNDLCVISAIVKPCSDDIGLFSYFLFLVLKSFMNTKLTLNDLSAFVLSDVIGSVYASRGIQFLQGSVTANIVGICRFYGVTRFMPLFCVDFSAIPFCFKSLHSALLLRYTLRSFYLVYNPVNVPSHDEEVIDLPDLLRISWDPHKKEACESGTISITPEVIEIDDGLSLPEPPVVCSRLARQNMNSKHIQTRRTSLKKRKAQNPSTKNRSNKALPFDSKGGREKSRADITSNKKHRSMTNSSIKDSKKTIDSSHCSANILVAESDRCYRVEGAVITSEVMPETGEWHLAVKKDGSTQYIFKAGRVTRPHSSNRYITDVRMISLINGWKLEFVNHQDWIAFKNLSNECSEREIAVRVVNFIPVPGVREVSDYVDSSTVPFNRPDYYISTNGNEFYRAMTRNAANYDMDSEDEEWLSKFNNEFQEHVSEGDFESIIDALEKAHYYTPNDCYDEKSVTYWCKNLATKEVVAALYGYWMNKRKHKHSSLLRIFQMYHSEPSPFVPKPFLRKKRSFKRHPSLISRSVLPSVLPEIAGEQDALDEEDKNAIEKIEAAKAAVNESMDRAIQKRNKAQNLAEKADLAVYKATMLVRIAEATQAGGSVEDAARHFLN